jgi:hypothetical protein
MRDAAGAQAVLTVWDGVFLWQRSGQADVRGTADAPTQARLLHEVVRATE